MVWMYIYIYIPTQIKHNIEWLPDLGRVPCGKSDEEDLQSHLWNKSKRSDALSDKVYRGVAVAWERVGQHFNQHPILTNDPPQLYYSDHLTWQLSIFTHMLCEVSMASVQKPLKPFQNCFPRDYIHICIQLCFCVSVVVQYACPDVHVSHMPLARCM